MTARRARWHLLSAASLVAIAATPRARAQTAVAQVSYQAADGCPTEAEFVSAVRARGGAMQTAADAASSIHVTITVDSKGGFEGSLRTGASAARKVHGGTCLEVMNALAIVAVGAIASDSTTAAAPAPDPSSDPLSDPSPAVVPEAPASKSVASGVPPIEPPRMFTIPPRDVTVGSGTMEFDRDISITGLAGVVTGFIPGLFMPTFDITVTRTNLVTTPEGTGYRLTPSMRLHLGLLADGTYRSNRGSVTLGGETVGIDSCAALSYDRRGLVFFACAEFAGGLLGYKVTDPNGVKGPLKVGGIGTVGVGLDAIYNLTRHFHLEARFGGGVILGSVSPENSSGQEIFKSSTFTMNAMIGAGGHF